MSSGEGTLPPPNDLGWWVGWLGPGFRCGFVLWLSSCSRLSVICRLSVSVLLFSQTLLILIIAGASADASVDESTDKFLKKNVFYTLFLIVFELLANPKPI